MFHKRTVMMLKQKNKQPVKETMEGLSLALQYILLLYFYYGNKGVWWLRRDARAGKWEKIQRPGSFLIPNKVRSFCNACTAPFSCCCLSSLLSFFGRDNKHPIASLFTLPYTSTPWGFFLFYERYVANDDFAFEKSNSESRRRWNMDSSLQAPIHVNVSLLFLYGLMYVRMVSSTLPNTIQYNTYHRSNKKKKKSGYSY